MYQISLWTNNFEFLDQICPRKIFIVRNRKIEHHHCIPLIQISLGTKFQLKLTILIFWPDLPKKGFSGLKQKKWTRCIFYIILHIQIGLVRKFSSNWQFWFFGPNLPKKVFPAKNWKREHHHWIPHIQISLGTKFQLKLIILSFWTKFTQKRYFQPKAEQAVQRLQTFAFYAVNVDSTVVFKHFKNLEDLIILNILKEKLVMFCLLGSFYLNIV